MLRSWIAAALALAFLAAPARADLVTVDTAAGIRITVAADMAPAMLAFIADLVARGIRPKRITCYSLASSHTPNSLHHDGHACDFDGSASRFPPMNSHRVSKLAASHGLRDGCGFTVRAGRRRVPDCGHIDAGLAFAHRGGRKHFVARHRPHRRRTASR